MMHLPSMFRQQKGFTLVETLVAITILMIAIVGPYYSIQQAIMISFASRDQLIASQLAQEGEEYIYYMRDTNYLSSAAWNTGLTPCTGTYGCAIDVPNEVIQACTSSGCPALKLAANGWYTLSGSGPDTRFTRTVMIKAVNSSEIQVTVTVNWITEHRSYSVSSVDDLYNWL